jgi:glutathione S-transferase
MEAALGVREGPWFLGGTSPSLVDAVVGPHLERIIASCLYWKALPIRRSPEYPNISR